MINLKTIAICTLISTVTATGVAAESFKKYGEVEGWSVYIDVEKKSCLIEAIDSFENVVQMGLTVDRGVAYVGVFTKGKTDIKRGKKKAIAVSIGDNLYLGESTGMRGDITKGYSGGYILTDDPQFVEDVAKQYTMTVFPEQEYAFIVDLTGTYKAIELAKKCNSEQL